MNPPILTDNPNGSHNPDGSTISQGQLNQWQQHYLQHPQGYLQHQQYQLNQNSVQYQSIANHQWQQPVHYATFTKTPMEELKERVESFELKY